MPFQPVLEAFGGNLKIVGTGASTANQLMPHFADDTAWKSTSAPLLFCTSGKEKVENLEISRGQFAPCQEKRIQRQQTVSSAGCKVLAPNAGFLLASMPSYSRFRPIECSYSESVAVSVSQDNIRGSAITRHHCTGRKGDSAIFCTKKQGYLRVCQATKRVDSIGERLYLYG